MLPGNCKYTAGKDSEMFYFLIAIHTFVQHCVTTALKGGLIIVHLGRAVPGRTVNTALSSGGM